MKSSSEILEQSDASLEKQGSSKLRGVRWDEVYLERRGNAGRWNLVDLKSAEIPAVRRALEHEGRARRQAPCGRDSGASLAQRAETKCCGHHRECGVATTSVPYFLGPLAGPLTSTNYREMTYHTGHFRYEFKNFHLKLGCLVIPPFEKNRLRWVPQEL